MEIAIINGIPKLINPISHDNINSFEFFTNKKFGKSRQVLKRTKSA